jgi:ParB-like chromosome segregation protein Spo0J
MLSTHTSKGQDVARKPEAVKRPAPEQPKQLIEMRSIDDLVPYGRNANKHSEEQIEQIVASIREFGWTNPILADEFIRAGHGRLTAARKIYASGETIKLPSGGMLPPGKVPVIDCTGWTDSQRRAYVLTDNQVARNAEWDEDLLRLEIGDLRAAGDLDLKVLGFSTNELEKLGGPAKEEKIPDSKYSEQFGVIALCEDEVSQQETFNALTELGYNCKVVTT